MSITLLPQIAQPFVVVGRLIATPCAFFSLFSRSSLCVFTALTPPRYRSQALKDIHSNNFDTGKLGTTMPRFAKNTSSYTKVIHYGDEKLKQDRRFLIDNGNHACAVAQFCVAMK